jgi:hypothetical protein
MKIGNAKKDKTGDLSLIAIFIEAAKRIRVVIKINESKIVIATLTKKERAKREKRTRTNAVEKTLNFVKNCELLAAFFPLADPYLKRNLRKSRYDSIPIKWLTLASGVYMIL